MSREEQLYKAVLLRVVEDAQKDGATLAEAMEAREWLLKEHNPDRAYLCQLADFSESMLCRWASTRLRPLNTLRSRLDLNVQPGRSGSNAA